MVAMGRYTAALILIAVGLALLFDQMNDSNYLYMLVEWWPALFIALGVEVILLSMFYRKSGKKLRFSFGSVFGAVIIAAVVMFLTGTVSEKFEVSNWIFWEDHSQEFALETIEVPLNDEINQITLENVNGHIEIKQGSVDAVMIVPTVQYSKYLKEDVVQNIRDKSTIDVEVKKGRELYMTTNGFEYRHWFFKQKSRMNVVLVIPDNREFNISLQSTNGSISAGDLAIAEKLDVRTINGKISISDIRGSVIVETTNGNITVSDVEGDLRADTTNGKIEASYIRGNLQVDTTNGDVTVVDPEGGVSVDTTNGDITIRSHTVNGNWNSNATNGDIEIHVPEDGNFTLKGYGDIHSNLNGITVQNDQIEGEFGTGQYSIRANTRGDLTVRKNQPVTSATN